MVRPVFSVIGCLYTATSLLLELYMQTREDGNVICEELFIQTIKNIEFRGFETISVQTDQWGLAQSVQTAVSVGSLPSKLHLAGY